MLLYDLHRTEVTSRGARQFLLQPNPQAKIGDHQASEANLPRECVEGLVLIWCYSTGPDEGTNSRLQHGLPVFGPKASACEVQANLGLRVLQGLAQILPATNTVDDLDVVCSGQESLAKTTHAAVTANQCNSNHLIGDLSKRARAREQTSRQSSVKATPDFAAAKGRRERGVKPGRVLASRKIGSFAPSTMKSIRA